MGTIASTLAPSLQVKGTITYLHHLLTIYIIFVTTIIAKRKFSVECWTTQSSFPISPFGFGRNSYSSSKISNSVVNTFSNNNKIKMTINQLHTAPSKSTDQTETTTEAPKWCPEKQIYLNGVIPSSTNIELEQVLNDDGSFRIFGYGSLCWNPGKPLSRDGVTKKYGKAIGWKRCWCQRSADHRGEPSFLGLVCTLLSDDEYRMILNDSGCLLKEEDDNVVSMAEGVIYTVPESVANDVLTELDFREKGGYSRDVIDVIEDETNQTIKALLYRGTPENPAFWKRPLLDLPFAAAIMSVAIGPSGRNDEYLYNLDTFLTNNTTSNNNKNNNDKICLGDVDTRILSNYCKYIQSSSSSSNEGVNCYFLYNCGSNQYNQLLLYPNNSNNDNNTAYCYSYDNINNDGDVMKITESLLVVSKYDDTNNDDNDATTAISKPKDIYAGGGHSALLLDNGMLYLWGCNDYGQLGRPAQSSQKEGIDNKAQVPYAITQPLSKDISVMKSSLGFSHTLIIENNTGYVYAFGDNVRGQVSSSITTSKTKNKNKYYDEPIIPFVLKDISCIDISAGLFHSAVITTNGELITFGSIEIAWKPPDDSKLIQVSCGRKHTIVLDEYARIWSFGDNKYGQLGRITNSKQDEKIPHVVDGILGQKGSGCFQIDCGWSHNIVMIQNTNSPSSSNNIHLYGWGRNDKGQLGYSSDNMVSIPQLLSQSIPSNICNISCGSEYSMLITQDGKLYSCGWNEHGNLGINTIEEENSFVWKEVVGNSEKIKTYFDNDDKEKVKQRQQEKGKHVLFAAGGAHFLSIMS